jgi:hypothetical protein
MKHILLLIIPILCEIFLFPNLKEKVISRTTIHFLSIFNAIFFTTNSFRENTRFTKLLPVFIMTFDYLFGKFIISNFYDPNCKYFDAVHSILIIIITLASFTIFADKNVFKEYEKSKLYKIHIIFADFALVYKIFYFYKYFHLKQGNIITLTYNLELVIRVLVNLLANNTFYILNNLLCLYLNKEKTSKELMNITKRLIFMLIAEFIFYSIYSFKLARALFETVFSYFGQPYNLIFYNILPTELDIRFRICLYISNWLLA